MQILIISQSSVVHRKSRLFLFETCILRSNVPGDTSIILGPCANNDIAGHHFILALCKFSLHHRQAWCTGYPGCSFLKRAFCGLTFLETQASFWDLVQITITTTTATAITTTLVFLHTSITSKRSLSCNRPAC